MSQPIKVDFFKLCQYIFGCCVGQVACAALLVKIEILASGSPLGGVEVRPPWKIPPNVLIFLFNPSLIFIGIILH